MTTVYVEPIPRGGYKFKLEISPVSLEVVRLYGYTLAQAKKAWRQMYGMQYKKINFVEV